MEKYEKMKSFDPEIYAAIQDETNRQNNKIELIASENFVSERIMEANGSPLTNKYAEGYPGKRYYGGCEHVDVVETLAIERAKELFGAGFANVQAHSGAQANMAVFFALLTPGDTVLSMSLAHGGHLSHGSPVNMSGKYFNIVPYGVTEDTNTIDKGMSLAMKYNKKVIYSAPRIIRNKEYNHLAKANNAGVESVQVGNYGSIDYFKDKKLNIDYYLNAFNSETINYYKEIGADTLCISQELNINEIKETIKYTDINIESVVYGYTPLMITEYCPMGVIVRDCKKDKRVAKCKESIYALRNSKGDEFRVSQDIFCRSTIYNSNVTCMLDNLYELHEIGINVLRLDFTLEDKDTVKEVIEAYQEVLSNDYKLGTKATKLYNKLDEKGTTAGHYYKGVE